MPARKTSKPARDTGPARASAARHAISRNTERQPGQGSDTMPSSDWMAESVTHTPAGQSQPTAPTPPGVPAASADDTSAARGKAVESRRGAHKSG